MKKALSLLLILLLAACAGGCGLFGKSEPLTLDRTSLAMTVGDSVSLSAGDAAKVHWTSADDKIAAVSGGVVTAKSAGATVITASLENGESASCNVTVTDKLIQKITLSAASARVESGKTIQLSATYSPSDASDTALSWSSGNEEIAAVNSEGFVTGVSEGTTTVSCKSSNGIEASCTVTVSGTLEPPTVPPSPATEKPSETEKKSEEKSDAEKHADQPSSGSGDYIFADSSSRLLTESEISERLSAMSGESPSGSYAQDAVNEIFARNGYVFKTESIRAYFAAKSWYHPDPSFDPSELTDIETYNITLLGKY